ncbi:hypothetical protein [Sulfurimonas autotrophica]|uniref:Leucine rich repeat variant n=1 Tax=Sulfurimonas autotrophica (strain ATCC BAA-671 / DSM 16294 / JCM 11897 / OK10) TaxID=563040 RepID=E0UUV9_SULAO|nr:hypothetical protein [Sulfurimonas autotrophica]ADN08471.1 conserved hypothetical protein [Sulfurimonas autotrophica DSM 16294]
MNLQDLKNTTILLLGKSRAFSEDEFFSQLKFHNISIAQETGDDVRFIVEGRMMSPYEQNMSDAFYEEKRYEFINIDVFEKLLAQEIDNDTLLMSLKLSNDKMRLKSFIQNSCIDDTLFFKLLKMYSFEGEDFFENDDNRDVSAALIGRFYENIERNHNVQYATTGIYHLIAQTDNEQLLEAIAQLTPALQHPKIMKALAMHEKTPRSVHKIFLKKGDDSVKEAMAYNANLDKSIIHELIKYEDLAAVVAQNTKLDDELFGFLSAYKTFLAANETLSEVMQQELFSLNEEQVHLALAQNRGLHVSICKLLLHVKSEEIKKALYINRATPVDILQNAYKEGGYNEALSANSATPQSILQELAQSQDEKILYNLAKNENTPVDILYQLQLDSRFERAVKTNEAFGKYIQSQNIGWLV